MSISEIIHQLKNYSGPLGLTLHNGTTDELIAEVERCYGIFLPDDFKTLYRFSDGFETDDDIFNIIPLAEIIKNKEKDKPLWIAEYLIYCDMWALEIHPENPNKYAIVSDPENKKTVLTNSLAEFIQALLNNGVFGDGGIYSLQEAAELEFLNAVRPENTATLLLVFYYGLINGIVTREEVVAWADMMILQEDEPHYFLIEISLSINENQLIDIIKEYAPYLTFGTIMVRTIYGLAYHKLIAGSLSYDKAFRLIGNYDYNECLSEIEVNKIYKIDESTFSSADEDAAKELLLAFLSYYKDFKLANYKDWSDINWRIGAEMDAKTEGTVSNHQYTSEASIIQASSRPKIKLAIKIIACVALVVIVAIVLPEELIVATMLSAIWIVNSIGEYKKWV